MNRLCQIAGVSRAGYYRFRRRHESGQASMTLRNQIQQTCGGRRTAIGAYMPNWSARAGRSITNAFYA